MIRESLELQNISKSFGGVKALDDISFKLESGKIYGLAGENGAGKSTTMKIINGAYVPDSGALLLDGKKTKFSSPLEAQKAGIGMVYQELNMLPDLNVAENVFISHLSPGKAGFINWKDIHQKTAELLETLDISIDTTTRLGDLKVAYQQLIAIVRALSRNCKVVILDEPTSALTDKDGVHVINAVRKLKELGYIVIYISHKLQEVLDVTDEIIVFRNGKKIGGYQSADLNEQQLAELIAGRKLETKFPKRYFETGDELLRFESVSVQGLIDNISFSLHKGEILGFAGLLGAGKSEIAKALFGVFGSGRPSLSGNILLEGEALQSGYPGDAIRKKVGLVPENRASEGLVTEMSVYENILMVSLDKISRFGWLDRGKGGRIVDNMLGMLEIKCAGPHQTVSGLSGGNQQKVVLAKWIAAGAKVIVFDEPTRGIDVGAKVAFYEQMNELVSQGVGVIILSSELEEVFQMSDRLIVLKDGGISAEFVPSQTTMEQVKEHL